MNEENNKLDKEQTQPEVDQISPKEVAFADLEPGLEGNDDPQNMDFLLDIPLEISVELGRTKIQIADLLKLSQGSVVELEKLTNQPLDILINQKLMARGDVVVVNDKFAIRLTNIISPGDRVKGLS